MELFLGQLMNNVLLRTSLLIEKLSSLRMIENLLMLIDQ